MATTYTKLKSGEWGIRIDRENAATAGQTVTVTKKSGETKQETVVKVVYSGNGITLCAVGQRGAVTERQADAGYGRGRKVRTDCCGYPCPVTGRRCTAGDPCHDCQ